MPKGLKHLQLAGGALLSMMRTMPTGDLHRGVVQIPDSGLVSDGLMAYMQTSEQVVSMISVGCLMRDGAVAASGGYIVQLLPELDDPTLMVMTERLKDFRTVDQLLEGVARDPDTLIEELLYGMPFTRLDESTVQFECQCSEVRVVTSLATLGRADIEDLLREGVPIDVSCDYCGREYQVSPEQLRGLLTTA
jgi:molecular chaperone Hsp33